METPRTPQQAHDEAVLNRKLPTEERIKLATEAIDGYKTNFDKARALRDRGLMLFQTGDGNWINDLGCSVDRLESEVSVAKEIEATWPDKDTTPARQLVQRELGASACMYGRLLLKEQLQSAGSVDAAPAFGQLAVGMADIEKATEGDLPDQYKINFAAMLAIAEAYTGTDPMSALRAAGRSALLACISESPTRVAHSRLEVSGTYKLKHRALSLARSGFAAFAAVAPKELRESRIVRTVGAKLV